MLKRMAVLICGAGVILMTSGPAAAQAVEKTKEKTKAAASKTGEFLSDAAITTAVKTKLLGVKDVIANDINVDTNEGVVTLKGSVPTEAQKTRAAEIARGTAGVKRVVNELTVQK